MNTKSNNQSLTILLIEDDDEFRSSLAEFLRREKFKVIEASNGSLAIQKGLNQTFDLIITDINMPIISGDQAIEKIRLHLNNQNTPVIALSGHLDYDLVLKLKGNIIKGFTKPVNFKEIVQFIRLKLLL